jgi:hypothetical protein
MSDETEAECIVRLNRESGHADDCLGTPGYKGICNCGKDERDRRQAHGIQNAQAYKPFSDKELSDLRQAVDEIGVAIDKRTIERLFATINSRTDECNKLRAYNDELQVEVGEELRKRLALEGPLKQGEVDEALRHARDLIAMIGERDALEAELKNRRQCSTCFGTPHASGLPCICGGTNNADEEIKGLRLAAMRAQDELANVKRYCGELEHDAKLLTVPTGTLRQRTHD